MFFSIIVKLMGFEATWPVVPAFAEAGSTLDILFECANLIFQCIFSHGALTTHIKNPNIIRPWSSHTCLFQRAVELFTHVFLHAQIAAEAGDIPNWPFWLQKKPQYPQLEPHAWKWHHFLNRWSISVPWTHTCFYILTHLVLPLYLTIMATITPPSNIPLQR